MRKQLLSCVFCAALMAACNNAPPAAPDKPAAPTATPTANVAAVEEEIKQVEQGWVDAEIKKDRAWYERHLAEELVSTSGSGAVQGKTDFIKDEMLTTHSTASGKLEEMRVQAHGAVAVSNYIFHSTGKNARGPYDNRQRYTDVWVKRNGAWQVVATHGSNIALNPPPAAAAAANTSAPSASPTDKDAQEIIRYEIEWGSLTGKAGVELMERLEAEEYFYTDNKGQVFNRAQDIAAAKAREITAASRELKDVKVTRYGDVAVITALYLDKSKDKNGSHEGAVRGTDVWVKRNGNWLCVAAHGSEVKPSRPAKKQ